VRRATSATVRWLQQRAPQPQRELEQVLRQCSIGALTLLRT